MFAENQRFVGASLFLLDLVLLSAAVIYAAAGIAPALDSSPLLLPVLLSVAWWLVTLRLNVYRTSRALVLWQELLLLVEAASLSLGLAIVATLCLQPGLTISTPFVLALIVAGLVINRLTLRVLARFMRERCQPERTTLIAGRGLSSAHASGGNSLLGRILAHNPFSVSVPGYLSFEGEATTPLPEGLKMLGTVTEADRVLTENFVDEVLVCPSAKSSSAEIQKLLELCETLGVSCHIAPDFLPSKDLRPDEVRWIGDIPTFSFHTVPTDEFRLSAKRCIDLVGATLGLLALSPFLLACALAIKVTSNGPALFRQTRVGVRGRTFTVFKFRSMYLDAEERLESLRAKNEQTGPVFKMRDDPRVTAIGRFLRRYSIDEMPQLLNVLKGEMSLVGPRPPLPREVKEYSLWQRRRLSVKPGLTCIWQVQGRNKVSFQRWMEMDMEYIDSWSLRLDLKLIARTFGTVLKGTGM